MPTYKLLNSYQQTELKPKQNGKKTLFLPSEIEIKIIASSLPNKIIPNDIADKTIKVAENEDFLDIYCPSAVKLIQAKRMVNKVSTLKLNGN